MDDIKVAHLADGKRRPSWVTDEFYGYVEEFINQVAWVTDKFHGIMVQNREKHGIIGILGCSGP